MISKFRRPSLRSQNHYVVRQQCFCDDSRYRRCRQLSEECKAIFRDNSQCRQRRAWLVRAADDLVARARRILSGPSKTSCLVCLFMRTWHASTSIHKKKGGHPCLVNCSLFSRQLPRRRHWLGCMLSCKLQSERFAFRKYVFRSKCT